MQRHKPISEFLVEAIQMNPVTGEDGLEPILYEISARFGLSHVTYFGRSISNKTGFGNVLLTTYPKEWVTHYFDRSYQEIDPIISTGIASLLPIQWSEIPKQSKTVRDMFGEAGEFGVGRQGVSVSVRGVRSDYALMSFNRDCTKADWTKFCLNSLPDLNYLAFLFHEAVLKAHSDADTSPRCRLTSREAETLRWAARGKTAWETAQILGLSEKTVNFYMANACAKLGVASKTQAVATVVAERLILL